MASFLCEAFSLQLLAMSCELELCHYEALIAQVLLCDYIALRLAMISYV